MKSAAVLLLHAMVEVAQSTRCEVARLDMEAGAPAASKKWADIKPNLKTGDLILFNSEVSVTSVIIKTFTWADFTHVGLVVVMKYDKDSFTWSLAAKQDEQDDETILCVMEVANHPTEDIVTGDKYHGFQISRLLDKMHEGYAGVTFIPLRSTLTDERVSKLQSIVSCLHTVRARYEKGVTGIARLMLLPIRLNSGQDLISMFCSDFVAYVAFEMGWLEPEDVGRWISNTTKNFSPQDFLSYIENSEWNEDEAVALDVESTSQSYSKHVATEAESYTVFPSQAAAYWLKRTLQYEHEVLQCRTSKLTYLQEHFPAAFQHFQKTFLDEIRAQQLWGGEVDWINGNGNKKKKYVRLVALVNDDGSKTAVIYYGDQGSDWFPNNALYRKTLTFAGERAKTYSDVTMTSQPPGTTSTFTFNIAKHDKTAGWIMDRDAGTRSFILTRPEDSTYGFFVSTLFKQVRVWATTEMSLTRMLRRDRLIWLFPSTEVNKLVNELKKTADEFALPRYESRAGKVQHVLYGSQPKPAFKMVAANSTS